MGILIPIAIVFVNVVFVVVMLDPTIILLLDAVILLRLLLPTIDEFCILIHSIKFL